MYPRSSPRHLLRLAGVTLLLLMAGCAHYPINPPIDSLPNPDDYRFNTFAGSQAENIDENFIILSFSGGGWRATSLAYGFLKELEKQKSDEGKTLLDDVNVISSVSGGSFASAYYVLYGKEKFFRDFKDEVLYFKLRSRLVRKLLSPWVWPSLWSPTFGKSDGAADYYDKYFFKNHTFADLPRKWPFLVINATDMSRGAHFSFVQEDFDRLCSDLNQVKLSRAVAASSAVPPFMTAVTLKNYPKSNCGYKTPDWVRESLAEGLDVNPQMYGRALTWKSYEDAEKRPYVHLSDGAISDNIGIRSVSFALVTDTWKLLKVANAKDKAKRVAIFIVDAEPTQKPDFDLSPKPPGFFKTILVAANEPMKNYSAETISLLYKTYSEFKRFQKNYGVATKLCNEIAESRCRQSLGGSGCVQKEVQACFDSVEWPRNWKPNYPELYLIHISFENIKDPELREKLEKIPTDLQLKKEDVDLLIETAGKLLEESSEYHEFVQDIRQDKLAEQREK